ncbi:DUF2726 domain-containing protein [Dyella sp. 2HG41-7]|uniref:DUF2726 domain-containing protein n=1 Tax=Dyella sp. 2HG41-7 TaxID=2883239 RepID=UPI001F48AA14|nr:DUF2726 domain-containing protein [Dyella sp. 2HG41-7]
MHGYAVFIPVFIILFALVIRIRLLGSRGGVGFPYVPAKTLFSTAERKFLVQLEKAVGQQYRIFGKVRIADVALVKPGLSRSTRQAALNKIASKHFDFIVCRANDLAVICAVELNDRSHSTQRAQRRDELVARVCQSIGLPLWTVAAAATYNVETLSGQFQSLVVTDDSRRRSDEGDQA